jgi:signal transduction protein with GAF and PtsI domain
MQPALLSAIRQTAEAAKRHGVEVAVCGEMAGTPLTAKALLGLGIESLSMNGAAIGRIKRMIRRVSLPALKDAAEKATKELNPTAAEKWFD